MNLISEQTCERERRPKLNLDTLRQDYRAIRQLSEQLCRPLCAEDFNIQSMPDVSPPKWHLAHSSWFFETFILVPFARDYEVFDPQFGYLFNSYYKGLGAHYPRHARGQLSRPTIEEIYRYCHYVNDAMERFFDHAATSCWEKSNPVLQLGLQHEQQHQELLLMDIKHIYFSNPLRPAYQKKTAELSKNNPPPLKWFEVPAGIYKIGADESEFAFDNETPRHRVFLEDCRLASRPVTNGEYLEFVQDQAYQNPLLWLSDAWDLLQQEKWQAPLYWEERDGAWWQMTLCGMQIIDVREPVCHLSYYEADAYARWAGKRLPTEAEWESVAQVTELQGNFLESKLLQPCPASESSTQPLQLYGDVWEWTASPYMPYPKFKPLSGALGEYNGKFMCNQMVLRGGSCFTPQSHIRASYRNFFPPQSRWQCSGVRLAED